MEVIYIYFEEIYKKKLKKCKKEIKNVLERCSKCYSFAFDLEYSTKYSFYLK